MDTREARQQVAKAREVLEAKGAPLEGTAAGHLILAIESLIENLDNSFGYTRQDDNFRREVEKMLQQHRLYGGGRQQ